MNSSDLLELTASGLYCRQGGFYIDPIRPVSRAVVTHGHGDHARPGSGRFLATKQSAPIIRHRLGADLSIRTLSYGEKIWINGVEVSLHPAGHILGSAQVKIEYRGQIWVVSGDFKTAPDSTCEPFEPLRCHVFVTESTFALPIFRWKNEQDLFAQINAWWKTNAADKKTSIIFSYALGKSQRILAGVDHSVGPIFVHGGVEKINEIYRRAGVKLPKIAHVGKAGSRKDFEGALIVAPPSADNAAWLKKFPVFSRAMASGWMQIRGNRRRRALDRGFALSDHSDWTEILSTIELTGAKRVWTVHGFNNELAKYLREEKALDAHAVSVEIYGDEAALEPSASIPGEQEKERA